MASRPYVPESWIAMQAQLRKSIAHELPQTRVRSADRRRAFVRRKVVPWLFVLPILLINLAVVAGPALSAVYYAMTDWNGIGAANWVGLDNFRTLAVDSAFRRAFRNNVIWLAMFLTIPIAMALIAASLLAPVRRGALVFRMALFIPYVLPSVITAALWRGLLSPDRGVPALLTNWGVPGFDRAFLGAPDTVLPAIGFVDNWHWWGFLMVLFLASMQNIPPDLYESARLDGASRWQEFRDVTLPGIRPTFVFMILMTTIWSFLTFDYIWILTQGGPAGASEVLAVLVFKEAFRNFNAGYAAAIGLTMSFFVGCVIAVFQVLRRRGWEI
ncbi:MAG: sugar ABC transporter permease [Chloroflexota bacterium]|nr:sugar ABC transporter permease [Chloroflexota bacterium]